MRLQVKAHHGRVADSVRAYTEKRLAKLGKRLYDGTLVEVTLERANNPSIADDHSAEAVVHVKGSRIVARESASTYEAAVDRLVDKLERQIERYRAKRRLEPRRESARRREPGVETEAPEVSAGREPESDEAAA
jgi:putative sigma-54 modulation protein